MEGGLAYRAWHAATSQEFEIQFQGKNPGRTCNGCGTCSSRFWRSDLEDEDGWLCNNCG